MLEITLMLSFPENIKYMQAEYLSPDSSSERKEVETASGNFVRKKKKRDCVQWLEQGGEYKDHAPVCVPREHFSSLLYVRVKLDSYPLDCCFNISRVRLFHFVANYL